MIPIRTSIEVQDIPGAVIGLIVANVAVFIFQTGLPDDLAKQFIFQNGLLPARFSDHDVARKLGLNPFNVLPFLTSLFMHTDWLHLAVNMWTLWLVGRAIEQRLGKVRFVLFYLACGLIAGLAHFAFNLDSGVPTLGASGAIAGVLGAYIMIYPTARIAILTPILFFPVIFHLPAVIYTGLWFAFQLAWGIADFSLTKDVGGIAWWAHIGGFLAGLALITAISGQRTRVREIGAPRARVREIGTARSRTIAIENQVLGEPQPKPQATGTAPREAGQDSLVRRLANRGRSVIPQSGA